MTAGHPRVAHGTLRCMDTLAPLLIVVLSGLLTLAPPVAVWRVRSPGVRPGTFWRGIGLALLGPSVTAYVLLVLAWLPAYSGQCGGWLGETTPCSGFGQYVTESLFWARMSLAVPGLLGIVLGVIVLIVRSIRLGRSRTPR